MRHELTEKHHKPLLRIDHLLQSWPLANCEVPGRCICQIGEPAADHCLAENRHICIILVREEEGNDFVWMGYHPCVDAPQIIHQWARV